MNPFVTRAQKIRDLVRRHGYVVAFLAAAASTAAFIPFRPYLGREQWGWLYLLVLGFIAGTAGVGPAVLSAILAFLCWNFFFIPPYHTFHVAESADVVHLTVFLVVAVAVGLQTGRLRDREAAALREEHHTAALNRLSGSLVSETSVDGLADAAAEELEHVVGAASAVLWVPDAEGGRLAPLPASESTEPEERRAQAVADLWRRVTEREKREVPLEELLAEEGACPADDEGDLRRRCLLLPLVSAGRAEGVLEVHMHGQLDASERSFLDSLAHLLAAFLESRRLNELAVHAAAAHEAERLRSALVSSVSHELKTPLASIAAAVTDLLDPDVPRDPEAVGDKLRDVVEDLNRLDSAIADLLDVSRLEAQAWQPKPDDFEVGEVVGWVVARLPRQARERVRFSVPENLPMLRLDFTQIARALHHVVHNALEYSDGPVTIGASIGASFSLWVADEGPGIADAEKPLVFDKFYRGASGRASRSSTGLGLSIAREIILANAGTIEIQDVHPHGTKIVLTLPLQGGEP